MQVSASRREDMPAFKADQCFGMMVTQDAMTIQPYTKECKILEIPLGSTITWWSKNYLPWIELAVKHPEVVKKYHHRFQFTINTCKQLEPGILISPWQRAQQMKILSKIGPVIWRYDPIVYWKKRWGEDIGTSYDNLYFQSLAKAINPYSNQLVISFMDLYPKVVERMKAYGYEMYDPPHEEKVRVVNEMFDFLYPFKLRLTACCEQDLPVPKAACIPGIPGEPKDKDKGQRKDCACAKAYDVGNYNQCKHKCLYCVDENTVVLMADLSEKLIKDVNIGDHIIGITKSEDYNIYKTCEGTVLTRIESFQEAYEITLANGTKLVCSDNHRWLSNRGWKYTFVDKKSGHGRFLTVKNKIRYIYHPSGKLGETEDYKRGYLRGLIDGDGLLKRYVNKRRRNSSCYRFRITMKDDEPLVRSANYLNDFGVQVDWFQFNSFMRGIRALDEERFTEISKIVNLEDTPDFLRGYVGGFFDSEGTHPNNETIRMADTTKEHRKTVEDALNFYHFDYVEEEHATKNKVMRGVRVRGNHSEQVRFFQTFNPAILRKRQITGRRLSYDSKIKSIVSLDKKIKMVDIQTTCETFIANGVISHNCYAMD